MESLHFKSVSSFHSLPLLRDCSIRTAKELKVSAQKNLEDGPPCIVADKVQRRTILQLVGVNVVSGNVCSVLAAPMQDMKEPNVLSIQDSEA